MLKHVSSVAVYKDTATRAASLRFSSSSSSMRGLCRRSSFVPTVVPFFLAGSGGQSPGEESHWLAWGRGIKVA